MAGTTTNKPSTAPQGGDFRQLLIEHNKLVDDLEALRAKFAAVLTKLDADAGVTDTNYSSTNTVAAATLTAAKIADETGTVIA